MPKRDSFCLIWLRLILTTLLGGTISTFLYSMSGSLLSYFGMLLVKQLGPKRVSIIGISGAAGGFYTMLANWSQLLGLLNPGVSCFTYPFSHFSVFYQGSPSASPPTIFCKRVDTLRRFQLDYERQTNVKWRSDSKIKESFMKLHPMWQAYPALQKRFI